MPQAITIEMAILGALIIESTALAKVIDILKPEIFYLEKHQIIIKTILAMNRNSMAIDILTVEERLNKKRHLKTVGGGEYLRELVRNIGSAAHIEYHTRVIIDKYYAREVIKVSHDIKLRALDDHEDIADVIKSYHEQMKELFDYIKEVNK